MNGKEKRIIALDYSSQEEALALVGVLGEEAAYYKVGMELFYSSGGDIVRHLKAAGKKVFLDLKLHDIPNTVGSAVRALSYLRPRMLTLHAGGGRAMMEAARKACDEAFPQGERPLLLAVTVLTSLDDQGLAETGVEDGARAQVLRLGKLAVQSGIDGLVCSAQELSMLRAELGDGPVLVTPGIRPAGAASGDQKRTMTPAQARDAGADWIVVGRPITQAADPAAAAAAIAAELAG